MLATKSIYYYNQRLCRPKRNTSAGPAWPVSCHLQPRIKKLQIHQHLFSNYYWPERWYWAHSHVSSREGFYEGDVGQLFHFHLGWVWEHSSSFVTQFGYPCWNSKKPTLGGTFMRGLAGRSWSTHPDPGAASALASLGWEETEDETDGQGHQSHLKGKALAL